MTINYCDESILTRLPPLVGVIPSLTMQWAVKLLRYSSLGNLACHWAK